ncbi:MAG: hypothetical protein AAFR10_12550 [Pseudomonadota bacterium]
MTEKPIDLDGRRTPTEKLLTESRRQKASDHPPAAANDQKKNDNLEDQMLAEPAQQWIELMKKWQFLLERYSSTPDADDERIQKLIRRAIGDMERLRKREERKKR